ncbi:protein SPEAR3 [Lolium perenne]|uniref:protein SPEAR3 n=1 Tax=Lolium perenne TaxID=4522 RepID=UPI0021F51331|nr:protein SPEAR3 [Lolium perenne]
MEWGRGRSTPSSSGSRRGKRGTSGGSSVDKPRQPQRGLGVAQLEKIRLQSEMAEYLHHPPLAGQPPPSSIHGAGSFNLQEDAWSSNSLSPPKSSSFHANNINVPSAYAIHPNLAMAYNGGRAGDVRYGESPPTTPIIRSSPNYHGSAIYGVVPHYSHPTSDATLPLFEPEVSIGFKGLHDLNHSLTVDQWSESMNSDDPQDVDLELKL